MKGPITWVTTFGLGRTPAQIGMIEVLQERGLVAEHMVGTSLGAVNAAAAAAGTSMARVAELWDWLDAQIFDVPVRTVTRGITGRQSRKQQDLIRERVAAILPERFDQLPTPLRLAATDLRTGAEIVLDSGSLVDAVMASSSIPGVMPPVDLGDGPLIDGGLVAGLPLALVPADTATVIVLDTGAATVSPEVAGTYRWWEVGGLSYAHLIRGQAVNALVHAAAEFPVVMLSTAHGGLLDFRNPHAMVEAGRSAAREQLGRLPDKLRNGIYGLPAGLREYEVLGELSVQ